MEALTRYGPGTQVQLQLDSETQELEIIAVTEKLLSGQFNGLIEALAPTCGNDVLELVRRRQLQGVGRYTIRIKMNGYAEGP